MAAGARDVRPAGSIPRPPHRGSLGGGDMTLGLLIIRSAVDIAGTGIASETRLIDAIDTAGRLTAARA